MTKTISAFYVRFDYFLFHTLAILCPDLPTHGFLMVEISFRALSNTYDLMYSPVIKDLENANIYNV